MEPQRHCQARRGHRARELTSPAHREAMDAGPFRLARSFRRNSGSRGGLAPRADPLHRFSAPGTRGPRHAVRPCPARRSFLSQRPHCAPPFPPGREPAARPGRDMLPAHFGCRAHLAVPAGASSRRTPPPRDVDALSQGQGAASNKRAEGPESSTSRAACKERYRSSAAPRCAGRVVRFRTDSRGRCGRFPPSAGRSRAPCARRGPFPTARRAIPLRDAPRTPAGASGGGVSTS